MVAGGRMFQFWETTKRHSGATLIGRPQRRFGASRLSHSLGGYGCVPGTARAGPPQVGGRISLAGRPRNDREAGVEFDEVWERITRNAGGEFRQKAGKRFTYTATSGSVVPSTTNRVLPRSHFEQAYSRAPLAGPGQLQDLQGPSYLWAILTDERIAPQTRG